MVVSAVDGDGPDSGTGSPRPKFATAGDRHSAQPPAQAVRTRVAERAREGDEDEDGAGAGAGLQCVCAHDLFSAEKK